MTSLLESLSYWHWFILGISLMIAEALLPGSFLLWFGFGAVAAGLALLALPNLAWQVQLVLFAVVSVGAIICWRRYRAANPETSSHPNLNQRGAQYVGRHFTLAEPIVDGFGRLHVDDTQWRIEGPDLPAGTPILVVGVDGIVLRIAAVK
jgi:membrane protein implicated in regulation of membrane protease activity